MREIYSFANGVIARLGEAEGNEYMACEATQQELPIWTISAMKSVWDLLCKTYQFRVWVVREVILAQILEIQCGSYHTIPERLPRPLGYYREDEVLRLRSYGG